MGSNNNNGGNRTKQELEAVQEEPFPEQRGKYRPLFEFEDEEFPPINLVSTVQFSELISGDDLFSDMYHGLFPSASYNDDKREGIAFLDYRDGDWRMHGSFDKPLLIMYSKRYNEKQLKKQEQPIFAAVVGYENPLRTNDVRREIYDWRDRVFRVFNHPIKEAGIYARQELVDKIREIVENR